jgi:pyruvate dehydrogenase (quinone)/pyruvate oxidase
MKKIAAELLVERLIDWGVDTVFGLPGDGINGIMEALRRHQDRIRFVLVHHEEAAAFMATGYAKSTGRLGVCLATSGPGGIHLLNGLYDAALDHAPVLAVTGMMGTPQLGTGIQQEVHLDRLFEDVTEYNAVVTVPATIPTLVDLAARTALARRGVAHLTFPVDIQEADPELVPFEGGLGVARTPETAAVYLPSPTVPPTEHLQAAARVLNEGQRIALLVGVGALDATNEVIAVGEKLGAPIVKTLPGKAVISDRHPLATGGLGLLGTRPSMEAMERCDTLLMVGTNYPYTAYLPSRVRVVQIEADPTRAGNRIPTEVPLIGDSAATLRALIPLLAERTATTFLDDIQADVAAWRGDLAALESAERIPMQPQFLARAIDRHAADNAILCCDSGTIATWAARHIDIVGDRQFYLCSNLASMACGLPYAIAAQVAHPGRQVVAFVGDGGFAMLMGEFLTAARNNLPITVVVCNNGGLGQILWEQMVLGYPEHGVRWERPAEFAPWAQSCGGFGRRIEDPAGLDDALAEALTYDGPALLDVVVNPDEPPMPPKIRYDQAKGFAEAFLRGQPRRAAIASTLLHDRFDGWRN